MRKLILSVMVSIFALGLFAQEYRPGDNGSCVKFTIKNFGINVSGNFTGIKGKIYFNPGNIPASSFTASVDAATINTGTVSRDRHLKKEEYFNVEKFPLISFISTKVTGMANAGAFTVEGNITIKGVTKPVSFPCKATISGDGYLFEGEFKLNRRDFGVGGSSLVMSENLMINLSVLAKK